jgi:bacteriocin biosynthesis cyclodehydratase domain-containing protein
MTDESRAVTDRPRIKPGFSMIAHGPGVVELRSGVWNARSVTLTDEEEQGSRLVAILDHLDGTRTEQEIARQVGVDSATVRSVVEELEAAGVAEWPATREDPYLQLLRGTLVGGPPLPDTSRRPVMVVGGGPFAQALGEALDPISPVEAPDAELAARLQKTDLTAPTDGLESVRRVEDFSGWANRLLVVAMEVVNPIVLRNVNWLSLTFRFPWIQAALDGPFALVGPTFLPRRSPCYECFESRMALTIREHASYIAYKRALTDGFVRAGRPELPRPIQGLLANLLALEVSNLLLTEASFTVGRVLSIYLPALEFGFNEFLRLPSCRVCVGDVERAERQLHFDLRAYVTERRQSRA